MNRQQEYHTRQQEANEWEEWRLQYNPSDVTSQEEIRAAWNYYTTLPEGHVDRIDVISVFSSRSGFWYYYTIRYGFRGQFQELCGGSTEDRVAQTIAIMKVLVKIGLHISRIPIPTNIPEWLQDEIRDRRRLQPEE
jgi:hypothetical protein